MSFPRPIRAVVFDLDGLLIDTETVYRAAMIEAGKAFRVPVTAELYARLVGKSVMEVAATLMGEFGPDFPLQDYTMRVWADVEQMLEAELRLKAGVIELLDHLSVVQIPAAVASSNSRINVDKHLARLGVRAHFRALVGAEDVTRHKPAPDPYLEAAARLGVDPADCLALEDSHTGVRAAHAAGMMTVMVPDVVSPDEEMHSLCVHVAESLHRVLDLLQA